MKAVIGVTLLIMLTYTANHGGVGAVQGVNFPGTQSVKLTNSLTPQSESTEPLFKPSRPINCEDFQGYLDDAILRWQKLKGTYFILIARLGARERGTQLNRYRLAYIEDYLKRHKVEYIVAQGSQVNGLGRMEFYVGGRVVTVIPIKSNTRSVCTGSTGG